MSDQQDLTYAQCRVVLDDAGLGKVAVSTPAGPRIIAVNYAVLGDSIVFLTSPYNTLGTYVRNATLAFEVSDASETGYVSSVVAIGRADIVDDEAEVTRIALHGNPQPWGEPERATYFTMPWSSLTGTRLRVVARGPASADGDDR